MVSLCLTMAWRLIWSIGYRVVSAFEVAESYPAANYRPWLYLIKSNLYQYLIKVYKICLGGFSWCLKVQVGARLFCRYGIPSQGCSRRGWRHLNGAGLVTIPFSSFQYSLFRRKKYPFARGSNLQLKVTRRCDTWRYLIFPFILTSDIFCWKGNSKKTTLFCSDHTWRERRRHGIRPSRWLREGDVTWPDSSRLQNYSGCRCTGR